MQSLQRPGDQRLNLQVHSAFGRWLAWLLLVVGISHTALATAPLTPHAAEYKVRISIVGGRLLTELSQTDDGFVARHAIAPTGLSRLVARGSISEVAEFSAGESGVIPLSYQSDDTLDRDEVHARVLFNWEANEASGTLNDAPLVMALEGLTHDRISIQYALMHDLLNGRLDSEYRMFEVDELKTINVRSIGSKEVDVPAGRFMAVGIQHQSIGSSRVTTLWCVEELGFLPVVIEQHRKGKLRVRATLRSYTPASAEQD